MKLPPKLQPAYERVVMAGKKVMYSPKMHDQMVELLKGPGSIGDKLGKGVVLLMGILISQSNHTMPPAVIIPAATELVAEAADFLRQSGMKVSDQDVAAGMAAMVSEIMQRAKIDPAQLPGIFKQGSQKPDAGPVGTGAQNTAQVPELPAPRAPAQLIPQGA